MSALDEVRALAAARASRYYRVERHTFDSGETVEVTIDDRTRFFDSNYADNEVSATEKALRAMRGSPARG